MKVNGTPSPAETRVLDLMRRGLTNAEICAAMEIKPRTLDAHINHIKLGWNIERPLRNELLARLDAELAALRGAA